MVALTQTPHKQANLRQRLPCGLVDLLQRLPLLPHRQTSIGLRFDQGQRVAEQIVNIAGNGAAFLLARRCETLLFRVRFSTTHLILSRHIRPQEIPHRTRAPVQRKRDPEIDPVPVEQHKVVVPRPHER